MKYSQGYECYCLGKSTYHVISPPPLLSTNVLPKGISQRRLKDGFHHFKLVCLLSWLTLVFPYLHGSIFIHKPPLCLPLCQNELLASLISLYTLVHSGLSTAPQPPTHLTAGKLSKVCPHKVKTAGLLRELHTSHTKRSSSSM